MPRLQLLHTLRGLREERRAITWKGLLKRRGWKLVLVAVVFYVVRDVILYVLIPLAVVVASPSRAISYQPSAFPGGS